MEQVPVNSGATPDQTPADQPPATLSKNEQKRRAKQEAAAARKAEKAAKAPPPSSTAKTTQEEEIDPRKYYENRRKDMDAANLPPQYRYETNTNVQAFLDEYAYLKKGEQVEDKEIRIAARIYNKRTSGNKLIFLDVKHRDVKLQVMCQLQNAPSPEEFQKQHEHIMRGDWVGIRGFPGVTSPKNRETGQLSVFAREVVLLSPCYALLPGEYYGFKDQEQRYARPYLDLIMNEQRGSILRLRSRAMNYIRNFFVERDFVEVETPMMQAIAGGATAKPFETFHNALNQPLYMRIAPELALKKLIVGGMDRVFEIGKNFRNEGIDHTHNPEFTSAEAYQAFGDMYTMIDLTEDLVSGLVKHITGSYETTYHTQEGEELHVNWKGPWKRVDIISTLEEATGEKFPPATELHTDETNAFLKRVLEKCKIECSPPQTSARIIDKLIGEFIEEKCINPTIIMNHPLIMSPLARDHRERAGLTERFEVFVCKHEIVNAYSELNDDREQQRRFEEQARQKAAGDDEAQMLDSDFIDALKHALPPTGGWGMGIDRVVMYLADVYNIQEVLAFPMMKSAMQSGQQLPVRPAEEADSSNPATVVAPTPATAP
ncbi:MAG: lysyl-tRNA synthetase [Cirrosporium novae-zelandiae]|nr:MAG: lysyl-tRNA synthetase [Cirrosporium novae-zelandiae]